MSDDEIEDIKAIVWTALHTPGVFASESEKQRHFDARNKALKWCQDQYPTEQKQRARA